MTSSELSILFSLDSYFYNSVVWCGSVLLATSYSSLDAVGPLGFSTLLSIQVPFSQICLAFVDRVILVCPNGNQSTFLTRPFCLQSVLFAGSALGCFDIVPDIAKVLDPCFSSPYPMRVSGSLICDLISRDVSLSEKLVGSCMSRSSPLSWWQKATILSCSGNFREALSIIESHASSNAPVSLVASSLRVGFGRR